MQSNMSMGVRSVIIKGCRRFANRELGDLDTIQNGGNRKPLKADYITAFLVACEAEVTSSLICGD